VSCFISADDILGAGIKKGKKEKRRKEKENSKRKNTSNLTLFRLTVI
jgi:hypothetical protein